MLGKKISEKLSADCSSIMFAKYLSELSNPTPVADSFGDRDDLGKDYPAQNQHEIQRKHICSWFGRKGDIPARTIYNRLSDPAMLLWIAESIGIDEELIRNAIRDVGDKRVSSKTSSQTAGIRNTFLGTSSFSKLTLQLRAVLEPEYQLAVAFRRKTR